MLFLILIILKITKKCILKMKVRVKFVSESRQTKTLILKHIQLISYKYLA